MLRRLMRALLLAIVLLAGGWAAAALLLSPVAPAPARLWLATAAGAVTIWALIALATGRGPGYALGAQTVVLVAVLVAFLALEPRHDRVWQADMARTPTGEVDGDRLTIRNRRDFRWTAAWEAEPRWEDRTYDLRAIEGVDLVASYWMGPHIAHLMVSFRFDDQPPLMLSVEIRKEEGEAYSALGGFFRNFELIYVAADERDLIGARTSFRGEEVYVLPLRVGPDAARRLLLDYVLRMNRLAAEPAWYNTLTTNCTTQIRVHANAVGGAVPWSWQVLLSGHTPELVHGRGGIATELPFAELFQQARVNDAALAAAGRPDFSARIRAGLALRAGSRGS